LNRVVEIDAAPFAFETERLRTRPLQADDEALYCGLYTDADTMRYIGEPMSSESAARSFRKTLVLMQQQPHGWLTLAIIDKATQQPIGLCGIPQFDCNANRLEIGILLRSEGRSRGFGRETLAALMHRTFTLLPVDELRVDFSAESPVAKRLYRGLGFKPRIEAANDVAASSRCNWSVYRQTWCNTGSNANN
jgi:RimJ/RimL family protein N-acetyltransferase